MLKVILIKISSRLSVFIATLIILSYTSINLFADPLFLTLPIEARGQALSGAQVSSAHGANAIRFNPAGLVFSNHTEIEVTHLLVGADISADSFLVSYPFANFLSFGVFASAMYLNDPFNKVEDFTTTSTSLSVSDTEFGFSGGYKFSEDLSAGLTLRYFRFQLGPEITQSFGTDLGVMYNFNMPGQRRGYKKFTMGLAIKNLGPGYEFYGGGKAQSQPLSVQGGLTYKGYQWATPSLDIGYSEVEQMSIKLGVDVLPKFYLSPKFGLKHDINGLSFSVGGGLGYGDSMRFNAIGGTTLGGKSESSNTFISLLFQRRSFNNFGKTKEVKTNEKITVQKLG